MFPLAVIFLFVIKRKIFFDITFQDTFFDVNQSWNTSTPVLSSCLSRSLLILPSFTCSIISLLYTLFLSTR